MKRAQSIKTVCIVESLLDLAEDTEYNLRWPAAVAHNAHKHTLLQDLS